MEKALRPKVWLKSGGYIVINQTEALVAIDINTGKYVGKSNRLEDTIVKINTDAIKEIVRQIRLRDLGGIIVVDFIDMDERKNRQKVMQALEEAMRADRAPYKILQFNDFGLVAITRKRVKQSLERTLCRPARIAKARGISRACNRNQRDSAGSRSACRRRWRGKRTSCWVNPEVAKVLKSNQNSYLQEIEEILGRSRDGEERSASASDEIRSCLIARQTRSGLIYFMLRAMVVRNISDAKAGLSALVEAVQKGSEVIIAKAGKPVARLVAYRGPSRQPRTPGSMKGEIRIAPDFDRLPDDMAEAFGIKDPQS